jgi:Ca-activated chloride channel family protein
MTRHATVLLSTSLLLPACLVAYDKSDDTASWGNYDEDYYDVDDEEPLDTGSEDTDECDEQTPITFWISPDDSNSMSSPVMAREAVLGGWNTLNNVSLRTWEFMNYYGFDYERPGEGGLSISAAAVADPQGGEGDFLMQIGVASPALAEAARDPMNIVLSLDTSGSMGGEPIQLLREVCEVIASQLRGGDVVSMVTWDDRQEVVLNSHVVDGPDDATLLAAIRGVDSDGSTNLEQGLVTAYELASDSYDPARINRVVLISDGGANVGVTEKDLIARHADREDGEGIYMVGVGVGTATSYHDALMDTVTDEGKGAAVFVGSAAEASAVFDDRFLEVMDVAARDVAVKLDLPPGFAITRFSGEEYSTDPQEVDPQHLAPNDAMVFQKHLNTCAPELLEEDPAVTVEVTWRDALSFEESSVSRSLRWSELLAGEGAMLWKGEAVFDYALALKAWKAGGAGSAEYTLARATWEHAQQQAEALLPGDADLAEIRQVMTALGY